MGGINTNSLAYAIQLDRILSRNAGNLDLLGGLSPQSDTVGQDELLASNASKRIADMQDRVTEFTTRIVKDLAWYLWNDPLIDLPLVKRLDGSDLEIAGPTARAEATADRSPGERVRP